MTKGESQILLDVAFDSCPRNLQQLRQVIRDQTERAGCSDELVQKLTLVVDEAVANVIRHAYHGDREKTIELRLERTGDELTFFLRDYAQKVDPSCIAPRDLKECRPGGLGINFMDSVMDSWEFREPDDGEGNLLHMTKKINDE